MLGRTDWDLFWVVAIVAIRLLMMMPSGAGQTEFIHGSIGPSTQAYTDCHRCALANIILANLYHMAGLENDYYYREARQIIAEHYRNKADSIKSCRRDAARLDHYINQEMARQGISQSLIDECPVETIPYNLFLCRMDWGGLEPLLPCSSSCSRIELWNEYHTNRGVLHFPEGWKGQLYNIDQWKVRRNVANATAEYGTFNYAKYFGQGIPVNNLVNRVRRKRQHGVLPVPRRFVQEFHSTNSLSIGNWTRQAKCREDEWPFAIEDSLPFGITIHCWGPMGFGGTHTLGKIEKKLNHKIDCNKEVEYKPPNGTYLIGMSNRVNYSTIDFLVGGVFLCSGEEKWTNVKNNTHYDTRNGTGEIIKCRPGSIFCTLELKMADFENKSVATDVRVGCCEVPERLFYSSLTLVPMRATLDSGSNVRWADESVLLPIAESGFEFENAGEIDEDFNRDYYAEPYGGFLNSVAVSHARGVRRLSFAYARFDDGTPTVWANQDPLSKTFREIVYNITCNHGFIQGLEVIYCSPLIPGDFSIDVGVTVHCSGNITRAPPGCGVTDNPPDVNTLVPQIYSFQCPRRHLICGFRKSLPFKYVRSTIWSGYQHTFICCPVVHTARSICGPSGAVLNIQPAKVNCIPVSGADLTCKTTQSFGYTMSTETSSTTSMDMSTQMDFGYTTADRIEATGSFSASISQSAKAKGGVPVVAEVDVETKVEAMVGFSATAGREKTQSNSTTNRVEEGFSFTQAAKTQESEDMSTETMYNIKDGQRALFYDVVKTCGPIQLKSEDFIRILTPTLKCDAHIAFEYFTGWRVEVPFYGQQTLTFSGYGLEIENDTFVGPLERGVNWDLISQGVREKFTESAALGSDNVQMRYSYDFGRAPAAIWQRSSNAISYNYTFDLTHDHNYRFYRLCGRCGRWRVNTESIWFQHGHYTLFESTNLPVDEKIKLEQGKDFRILGTVGAA